MNMVLNRKYHLWFQFSLVIFALVISYWESIHAMVEQWLNNDDFSHGLLIIPISIFLAWKKRNKLDVDLLAPDWRILPLLFAAIAVYIIGELGAELFTVRFSLLVFFISALWFLFGTHLVNTFRFPLLFLFLMLPLPGFVYRNLTFPLQILSSKWAVAFLNTAGVLAYREGNVIDLGFSQLQVVEACNGLRFILPLFTLGVLFAFWKYKPLWKRLLLVIATIPIAITANIFRIGGTGILSKYYGQKAAEGFFHSFSGWAVFMVSFSLFFLLNWLIGLIPSHRLPTTNLKNAKMPGDKQTISNGFRAFAPIVVILIIVSVTPVVVKIIGNVPPRKLQKPLSYFPLQLDKRNGYRQTMEQAMWDKVGGQDYFLADYEQQGKVPINIYIAYYEAQRKGGDFIHSPRLCLPGAGWFIDLNHTRQIAYKSNKNIEQKLKLNELVIRKEENAQLVYFWYQGRDRNFTSEWAAKFFMVWDGIWRRRTDGALVRLVVPLISDMQIDQARQIMDHFAIKAFQILDQEFLP